jgi:hypothetical protein
MKYHYTGSQWKECKAQLPENCPYAANGEHMTGILELNRAKIAQSKEAEQVKASDPKEAASDLLATPEARSLEDGVYEINGKRINPDGSKWVDKRARQEHLRKLRREKMRRYRERRRLKKVS